MGSGAGGERHAAVTVKKFLEYLTMIVCALTLSLAVGVRDPETGDVRVCLLYAGHDTDPAGPDEHRDGELAWQTGVGPGGVRWFESWLCSERVT